MQYNTQAPARRFGRSVAATVLMCGVATVAFTAPTTASAKAKRHHAAPHAAVDNGLKDEVQALRTEVEALKAWKDSQSAAQAQTDQQLAAARQQAADATARAEHAEAQVHDQILTIPGTVQGEVKSQVAKAVPPRGWEGSTSVSGRMYYDITSLNQKSNGVPQSSNGVGFDVKRFYIGIDHKFNDMFSANITTDFNYLNIATSPSGNSKQTVLYIKKAYLQAKFNDALIVRLGSADLPWVPFMEDAYGNRYIENVIIDRDKFGTSADWGVHALGKLGPNGMFGYQVSVINGSGYKAASTGVGSTRTHSVDVEGRVNMNIQHFTFALGGYDGKLGNDTINSLTRSAQRFDAAAIYNDGHIRVGGEYFKTWNWTSVPLASTKDEAEGYSIFGSYNLTKKISVFGRYDWVNPRQNTVASGRDNYFNVGISYEPVKIVDFALVYKRDSIDNLNLSTSNGTIGSTLGHNGTYDEVGLWGQVRW